MNGILRVLCLTFILFAAHAWCQSADRIIKAGDKVQVTCEEEPSLNRDYTITRDGLILLSFVGAVEVGGLTANEAARRISTQLVDQRILKRATVTLTFADSETKPIRVSGAVKVAGDVPFRTGLRLGDVLRIAEPLPAADLMRVQIVSEKGEKLVVDATRPTGNPDLRPGDSVMVPIQEKPLDVLVLGGVEKPGAYRYEGPTTVRKAIEAAGGFGSMGDAKRVRFEPVGKEAELLDLTNPQKDAAVGPGDRIVVELLPVRRFVKVEGEVQRPGLIEFRDGLTLGQAVAAAGGFTSYSRKDRVSVYSVDSKDKKPTIYNVDEILKGYVGDIRLRPGDRIVVARNRRAKVPSSKSSSSVVSGG